MKKYGIVYFSKTGNTKKIAEAMFESNPSIFDLIDGSTKPDLSDYSLIVFGYWAARGGPEVDAQEVMKTVSNKPVILFQTLGEEDMGSHAMSCAANGGASLGENCKVWGVFSCRGAIDPKLLEAMKNAPPNMPYYASPENLAKWSLSANHPNEDDCKAAQAFIKRVVERFEMFSNMKK